MFELLTKSKIRKKIILLFLYNPGKEFYLSEVGKKVGTSAGTAQRELGKLIAADMLIFRKFAGTNLYKLNEKYALLEELKGIVKKTAGVEVELKRELEKIKSIQFAFLFGSYAKGGFQSDSDIDLFVIGDISEDDIFHHVKEVEDSIGREINYHISGVSEYKKKLRSDYFHRDILKGCSLIVGDPSEFRRITHQAP